jgi:hypothetical protein
MLILWKGKLDKRSSIPLGKSCRKMADHLRLASFLGMVCMLILVERNVCDHFSHYVFDNNNWNQTFILHFYVCAEIAVNAVKVTPLCDSQPRQRQLSR